MKIRNFVSLVIPLALVDCAFGQGYVLSENDHGWKITRTKSPIVYTSVTLPNGNVMNGSSPLSGGHVGYVPGSATWPGKYSAYISGEIEFQYDWVGSGPVPSQIFIFEQITAHAGITVQPLPGDGTVYSNPVLFPSYLNFANIFDPSYQNIIGFNKSHGGGGGKIMTKKNPPASFTLSRSPFASMVLEPTSRTVSYPPYYSYQQAGTVAGNVGVGYTPSIKMFGVTISRPGARGETVDNDGTIHGHTTRSYVTENSGSILNTQNFVSSLVGDWPYDPYNDPPNWSWSPQHGSATVTSNSVEVPFGSQNFGLRFSNPTPNAQPSSFYFDDWHGSTGSPTEMNITYTATTTSIPYISASASYVLHLHDHFEPDNISVMHNVRTNITRASDNCPINNTNKAQACSFTVNAGSGHSIGGAVSGDVTASKWARRFYVPAPTFNLSFDYTYTWYTEIAINVPGPMLDPGQFTWLERTDLVDQHRGTAKEWDTGGYVGEKAISFDIPKGVGWQAHMPPESVYGGGGAGG